MEEFTHEKPVFDVEGVLIRKGDTVWCLLFKTKLGGKRFEVVQVKSAEEVMDSLPHIIVKDDDGATYTLFSYNLTHREPDSPERIKADRELTTCEYNEKYPDAVAIGMENHILDRAIALMERGVWHEL